MNGVRRVLAAAAIALGFLLAAAAPVWAAHFGPDSHASCVATLTTDNTHHPEGVSRADIAHLVKDVSDLIGLPPGAFYRVVADAHLGTIALCLGAIPAP